jgi:cell division protein ZapA (FtsZ GTPase activity inhibitor)
MHEIKKYTVTIFDTVYTVRSDEPEQIVQQAAELVDSSIKGIIKEVSSFDHKTIAILVALNIASKLKALELSMQEKDHTASQLIKAIDTELAGPPHDSSDCTTV